MENAMGGCTASHGAVLAHIAQVGRTNPNFRALVLEDDFKVLHSDFTERFERTVAELPAD